MKLNLAKLTRPQYRLQIFTNQLTTGLLLPVLEDTYLNTVQSVSLTDTTNVDFTINTGIPASFAPNRFRIVFYRSGILPVTFTSVSAVEKNKDIEVSWSVAEDGSTVIMNDVMVLQKPLQKN